MKLSAACVLMICLFIPVLYGITQTGTLVVTVRTESDDLLPGAAVEISSSSLIGARTALTGANGRAMFRNLPPGVYDTRVLMEGYRVSRFSGITVNIQKTTFVTIRLRLGETRETLTVTGTAPLIDTTSNTVSAEFDYDNYINHMPVYRHYTAIAGLAGGALSANDPSVFGAGSYDNLYLIEGVTAIDSRTQTWGGQFNLDIVQDMSFQTAGISAEYGHATGSVFNIVTKSGSNEFHLIGRLELFRTNWNDITENSPDRKDDDVRLGDREDQWNFSGGGFLVPDLIWWYSSYTKREMLTDWQRRENPMDIGALTPAVTGYIGHFFSIKGTLQFAEGLKGVVFYKEDPIDVGNAASYKYFGSKMQPEADEVQKQGGHFIMATGSWVPSEDILIEARWTDYHEELDLTAQDANPDGYWIATTTSGTSFISDDKWFWGAYPYESLTDRNHNAASGSVNFLIETSSIGSHDLKTGIEYLDEWCVIQDNYFPGGEGVFTSAVEGEGFDKAIWIQKIDIINRLPAAEEHLKYWTFYIQDSAKIGDSLTLNIGIRSDAASAKNNQDVEVFSNGLLNTLAPRAGFALAIGDATFSGSFGRYYDLYSMFLIDYLNTYPIPEVWGLWWPEDGIDGRNGWKLIYQWTVGDAKAKHTLQEDLTPQYVDEFSAGFDYPFGKNIAVGINGVWRTYRDLIIPQDIDGDKKFNIENLRTDAYGSKWKEHLGLVLSFRKRPTTDNIFLSASLTFASTEGLCADTLATGLGSYANNPLQRYDNANEWWGPIPTTSFFPEAYAEPTIIAKLQGVYTLPNDWYIGVIATWHNGFLPTTYDETYIENFGKVTVYPNGRGDMERLPSQLRVDLQFGIEQDIECPFNLPLTDNSMMLGIYANILNLLNEQVAEGVQQFTGSPNYGEYTAWTKARSYTLGFRVEF